MIMCWIHNISDQHHFELKEFSHYCVEEDFGSDSSTTPETGCIVGQFDSIGSKVQQWDWQRNRSKWTETPTGRIAIHLRRAVSVGKRTRHWRSLQTWNSLVSRCSLRRMSPPKWCDTLTSQISVVTGLTGSGAVQAHSWINQLNVGASVSCRVGRSLSMVQHLTWNTEEHGDILFRVVVALWVL